MIFLGLIAGLAGLWLGTEITIRGAVSITSRLGLPEFIVGAAILSVGSDIPELAVAVDGAIRNLHDGQTSDVVVGSAIGSSLGQIGFVLGLTGLFATLALPRHAVYRHGSVLLGSLILLAMFGLDGAVSRTEGISLVTVYVIYFVTLITEARDADSGSVDRATLPLVRSWLYLASGLGVVIASAELTVSTVMQVARAMNVEESLIAIIVIGLGTSLPELSISIGAVLKRRGQMSVGNLIGSNIFDTLMPIGVAATISGLEFDVGMLTRELPFLFGLSFLVMVFFYGKKGIRKYEAATILGLYCGYAFLKLSTL